MHVKSSTKKLLALLCQTFILSVGQANVTSETAIGQVTMIIGQSYATDLEGDKRRLQRASDIFIGDRIETDGGAHVHIRFIDDGRVSVRPESRLYIENYYTDTTNPANNVIRFYLEQGVLRSISGKATEAAHDRYRLNTPIAALGVLGTDYVIRTTESSTWAAVYSGGITLAPIGGACDQAGLGSCANATALTETMRDKYLEVNAGDMEPKIKSRLDQIGQSISISSQTPSDKTETPIANPSEGDNELASKQQDLINQISQPETENQQPPPEAVSSGALVWGRWPWQSVHADDTLSKDRETARDGREITVGNSYAGLFRATGETLAQPQTGTYQFNLLNSHVVFARPGQNWQQADKAQLNQADLTVDFSQQKFNTQLQMSHDITGPVDLNVQGDINSKGIFTGATSDSRVAGALSNDNESAGMLFEKNVPQGNFSGITEWQR
jgi:hypothetical protein